MNLKRIVHLALTGFVGQGISIITQLLIPPFFLRFYGNGVAVYGEWIALSASVNYLGTLNYGIQTFANNEMTILYNGGDIEDAKVVQASAFRLLLSLVVVFSVAGLVVLFIPISRWLNLRHVGNHAAQITLYLLILQIAVSMIFSLLTNSYMVVGELPRGNYWAGAQRLFTVFGMAIAIWFRSGFPVLAMVQLGSLVLFMLLVLVDVRRRAPILLPSLKYGNWRQTAKILKPSGHFGLIAIAGFLTWQGPVILIQKVLGPSAVAIFALVRVVFQMSRQLLSIASSMVSQEITLLVGQKDWKTLRRLYDLSERVVLFLIPLVSVGSLLMCPLIFTVWLHKRSIYEPSLCLLMAITSAVLGIKEHKTQFQASSNEHEAISTFILSGYTCMLAASIFTMKLYGLTGFMLTWIAWEIIQTIYVVRMNAKLFPPEFHVTSKPLVRLAVFMCFAFALAAVPSYRGIAWPLPLTAAAAVLVTAVLGAAAFYVFGLEAIWSILQARLRGRFAKAA